MLQLTDTTLFHLDFICSHERESSLSSSYSAKKNFSGPNTVRNVQTWRSKVQSLGATRQVGGSSASNQSYATTIPNTEYTDSAPSPRAHPVTPMGFSNDGVRYRGFDNEANEDLYRDALANLPKRSQRVPSGVRVMFILCDTGCSHVELPPGYC